MTTDARVAVIGLDCGTPQLLFDSLKDEIPNINSLIERSMWGELESITPPITVPAWACAMSGKTPGQLGIYGFRNRKDSTYDGLSIATSDAVKASQVWDLLGAAGKKSLLIGVPPGYPPKPVEGWRISCFLTPPSAKSYTWPPELATEVEEEVGEYIFDIPNFREQGFEHVHQQVYAMTERRFKVARRFLKSKPWDYFHLVEMGPDRLHHVFWHFCDPAHPKYEPGNPFETAFRDYYRYLDKEVGTLLELIPPDAITILMSDHGARPMIGGVTFNDWLQREGYLHLTTSLNGPTPIAKAPIDWSKTMAWGDGGYYGRLFLNVKGREPQGVIEPSNYEAVREELIHKLEAMPDHNGEPMGTIVYKPEDVYSQVNGIAPDLIVYFGDLEWRSVGTIGTGGIYTFENDTGPDGANHAQYGVFAMAGAPGQPQGRQDGMRLIDVGPTIMKLYGLDAPEDVTGRSML